MSFSYLSILLTIQHLFILHVDCRLSLHLVLAYMCVFEPSLYQLSVNENRGQVKPADQWSSDADFTRLLHIPVKQHNDYFTIGDVFANGHDMNGDIVSLMAIVKQVYSMRLYCYY